MKKLQRSKEAPSLGASSDPFFLDHFAMCWYTRLKGEPACRPYVDWIWEKVLEVITFLMLLLKVNNNLDTYNTYNHCRTQHRGGTFEAHL